MTESTIPDRGARIPPDREDISLPGGMYPAAGPTSTGHPPAGFWVRLGATIVDLLILGAVPALLLFLLVPGQQTSLQDLMFLFLLAELIVLPFIPLLYFSLFEWSRIQATPGKWVFGLVVTDRNDRHFSLIQAGLRYLVKAVYGIPLVIGWFFLGIQASVAKGASPANLLPDRIMGAFFVLFAIGITVAGFTGGRQGFHDQMAGTRVSFRSQACRDSPVRWILAIGVILVVAVITLGPPVSDILAALPVFSPESRRCMVVHPCGDDP